MKTKKIKIPAAPQKPTAPIEPSKTIKRNVRGLKVFIHDGMYVGEALKELKELLISSGYLVDKLDENFIKFDFVFPINEYAFTEKDIEKVYIYYDINDLVDIPNSNYEKEFLKYEKNKAKYEIQLQTYKKELADYEELVKLYKKQEEDDILKKAEKIRKSRESK